MEEKEIKKQLEDLLQKQEKEMRHFFKYTVKLSKPTPEDEAEFSRILGRHKEELAQEIKSRKLLESDQIHPFIEQIIHDRLSTDDVMDAFKKI